MKPRSLWTGFLKISLVTIPVRIYTAICDGEKIAFNQLHKDCHQRIRQKLVCPVHGDIQREDLVKGYQYATDQYAIVNENELEQVRLETNRVIDLVQFISPKELDALHLDTPYYVGPDEPVAQGGFAVLREALRRSGRIGLGRVILSGREKTVALKPLGQGMMFFTLRAVAEVKASAAYFEDLAPQSIDEDQVRMAQKLIANKCGRLNLAQFTDRYQTAVLDLIKAKIAGAPPIQVPRCDAGKVLNLMDALRQSLAQAQVRAPARKAGRKKLALAA